jgi:hypothetical protein
MAEGTKTSKSTATIEQNGRKVSDTVVSGAQDVADMAKSTYDRAAERLPDAVAGAQSKARDAQRALEGAPNQGLIIGTSFSLGLGVGLFMTGANRLLVVLALAPAAAMAATLVTREQDGALKS